MEISKITIWEDIYRQGKQSPFTVINVESIIRDQNLLSTDSINIDYDNWASDNDSDPFTIIIQRGREETDEEYAERIRIQEEFDKSLSDMIMIPIPKRDYEEMKEKAWKYDQLNK